MKNNLPCIITKDLTEVQYLGKNMHVMAQTQKKIKRSLNYEAPERMNIFVRSALILYATLCL